MEARELLKKLGISEPTDEQVVIADDFAKSSIKGVEDSMQKRINTLTKEKYGVNEDMVNLKADKEALSDQLVKLQEKYNAEMAASKKYKDQYEEMNKKKSDMLRGKWKQVLAKLDIPETDKRFENAKKVKEKLGIVGLDKPEDLESDMIEAKLEIYDIYAETGFVDKVDGTPPPSVKKGEEGGYYSGGVVSQAIQRISGKKP